MQKIEYQREILDLVKDLTEINNSVIFEKDNNKVVVKRADAEVTLAYILEAPAKFLNYGDDQIAFYNYSEFYQFFNAFDSPELKRVKNKLIISESNSKIEYLLSNPESITPGPKRIQFDSPDIKFVLNSSDLDEITKMNALISAKKAKIIGDTKSISVIIYNSLHENSFEKKFKIENLTGFKDNFEFVISSDLFSKVPQKKDYISEIKKEGFVKMSLNNEKIGLNIFTGYVQS